MMFRPWDKRKDVEVAGHSGSAVFINHYLRSNDQRVRTCPSCICKLVKHDTRANRAVSRVQWALIVERTLRILLVEVDLGSVGTESVECGRPDIIRTIRALRLRIFTELAIGRVYLEQTQCGDVLVAGIIDLHHVREMRAAMNIELIKRRRVHSLHRWRHRNTRAIGCEY